MPIAVVILTVVFTALGGLVTILINVLSKNSTAINSINMMIAEITKADEYKGMECSTRHRYIDEKFKKHDVILSEHDRRINKLEK